MSADADQPICNPEADTGRWTGAQLLEHWRTLELGAEDDLRFALGSAVEALARGSQDQRPPGMTADEERELRLACRRMGRELAELARRARSLTRE